MRGWRKRFSDGVGGEDSVRGVWDVRSGRMCLKEGAGSGYTSMSRRTYIYEGEEINFAHMQWVRRMCVYSTSNRAATECGHGICVRVWASCGGMFRHRVVICAWSTNSCEPHVRAKITECACAYVRVHAYNIYARQNIRATDVYEISDEKFVRYIRWMMCEIGNISMGHKMFDL